MRYDKERIINDFNLVLFGSQGWLTNKNMECPFCGQSGKWGVIFNPTGGASFHCWKCPRKTTLFDFLKKNGRTDLAKITYTVPVDKVSVCPKIGQIDDLTPDWVVNNEKPPEEILKPVSLPLRIKPLSCDSYLDSRGFKKEHYLEFEPSFTDTVLEPELRNFIIFKMKVDGVCVAWWARSRFSKEWHENNLKDYKSHKEKLILRYRNSENNFQNLLGGCDEIVKGKTDTVIIVEGIFDKVNVDNLLGLHNFDHTKCCFTFGNNIGQGQIKEIKRKGVENVILLYDFGTINESKDSALKMRDIFRKVLVTAIREKGIDPGNINLEYLKKVLSEAQDPINYFYNKVEMKL